MIDKKARVGKIVTFENWRRIVMKSIKPKSSGLAAFLVAAAIGFSMPVDASCIVSGDTTRDSAVSVPFCCDAVALK